LQQQVLHEEQNEMFLAKSSLFHDPFSAGETQLRNKILWQGLQAKTCSCFCAGEGTALAVRNQAVAAGSAVGLVGKPH